MVSDVAQREAPLGEGEGNITAHFVGCLVAVENHSQTGRLLAAVAAWKFTEPGTINQRLQQDRVADPRSQWWLLRQINRD